MHAHCPVYQVRRLVRGLSSCRSAESHALQISAEGPYACLCTFLETLLTMIWWVHVRTAREAQRSSEEMPTGTRPPSPR